MTASTCPFCDDDWDLNPAAHWMLDGHVSETEAFLTLHPCCDGTAGQISNHGYEAATGRTLLSVVREFTGLDVLAVLDGGDGTIVCRLAIVDPTVTKGQGKAASPPGWQSAIFGQVDLHHRHHPAPVGWKYGVAVYNGRVRVGVAVVSRPVSRQIQRTQPSTLEVTRVCTWTSPALRKNASTKLYGAVARRARTLGYDKLITYTLDSESGHSLVAAGWTPTSRTTGGSWDRDSRSRSDNAPTCPKVRWEKGLTRSARRDVSARALPSAPKLAPERPALRVAIHADTRGQIGMFLR